MREDEKLGRGGDKWSADPSSTETSEPEGVNAPNTPGRLNVHLGEEVVDGVFCGLLRSWGGARDPSLNVRPWRPMERENRWGEEWRLRLGEES